MSQICDIKLSTVVNRKNMSHIDSQRKRERQREIKHIKHVGTTRPNLI